MRKSIVICLLSCLLFGHYGFSQITWNQISQPGVYLNIADEDVSFYFYNEKVGSHGMKWVLNKSTDGGHTFSMIKTKTGDMGCYSMEEMFFINADTGFFSEVCQGIASIYKTLDGGANWTDTGMGGSYGISMFFLREDYGYYSFYPGVPNDSYLMRNGAPAFITKKYVFAHNNYQYPGQKTEIYFKNDSTGLIMCRDSLNHAVIINTANYGVSWTETINLNSEQFHDMFFISDSIGFVVGTNGTILRTTDFGEKWNSITINLPEDLNSIDFADDGVGYITGNFGTVLKSTDMGESWASTNFINTNDLIYGRLFDNENAYILDANGKLYSNQSGSTLTENRDDGISIYPNPVNDKLHLFVPKDIEFHKLEMYDLQGRSLLISMENEIDLSNYSRGIYLIKVEADKGIFRRRIIKR